MTLHMLLQIAFAICLTRGSFALKARTLEDHLPPMMQRPVTGSTLIAAELGTAESTDYSAGFNGPEPSLLQTLTSMEEGPSTMMLVMPVVVSICFVLLGGLGTFLFVFVRISRRREYTDDIIEPRVTRSSYTASPYANLAKTPVTFTGDQGKPVPVESHSTDRNSNTKPSSGMRKASNINILAHEASKPNLAL
jgi:type IV secretory pathway VirB2 component (pilin)